MLVYILEPNSRGVQAFPCEGNLNWFYYILHVQLAARNGLNEANLM